MDTFIQRWNRCQVLQTPQILVAGCGSGTSKTHRHNKIIIRCVIMIGCVIYIYIYCVFTIMVLLKQYIYIHIYINNHYYDLYTPTTTINIYIYIWLVFWNMNYVSRYWECHNTNWRTHIFQRGRYTTNQIYNDIYMISWNEMISTGPYQAYQPSHDHYVNLIYSLVI